MRPAVSALNVMNQEEKTVVSPFLTNTFEAFASGSQDNELGREGLNLIRITGPMAEFGLRFRGLPPFGYMFVGIIAMRN